MNAFSRGRECSEISAYVRHFTACSIFGQKLSHYIITVVPLRSGSSHRNSACLSSVSQLKLSAMFRCHFIA